MNFENSVQFIIIQGAPAKVTMDCKTIMFPWKQSVVYSFGKHFYIWFNYTCMTTDGIWTGDRNYCSITDRNYNSLNDLHTLQITVTAAHIKSSMSSLVLSW
jgi:hypothetical protein